MKRTLLVFAVLFFSFQSYGVIEVGESVPDMCWNNELEEEVCLSEFEGTIRVLIYSAGY